MEWQSVESHRNGKAKRRSAWKRKGDAESRTEWQRNGKDRKCGAEKRNRADLISGGTEWICLALSRRGMDANCREMDERSRAVKRKSEAEP